MRTPPTTGSALKVFFFLFFGPCYDEIAWFSISPYFRALYVVLKVSISQKLYMYHTELAELLK